MSNFRLVLVSGPYSDDTAGYEVVIVKNNVTMRDMLNELINQDRMFGEVVIDGERYDYKSYKYPEEFCPKQILDKIVLGGQAAGGWGLMNFEFTLKNE